jgi:hypothetical protein
MLPFQMGNGSPRDFILLNPLMISSLFKWKFVICLLVCEETNIIYLFENRLNGLNVVAQLCSSYIDTNVVKNKESTVYQPRKMCKAAKIKNGSTGSAY